MQVGERFIGRDREVAQLDLSIGPGNDGLRLVMLSGPSGRGKTTLMRVTVDRAVERGYRLALGSGRAGSLSTPFAPWIEALPELKDMLDKLADDGLSRDMEQIGIALVGLLSELCAAQPLLLVFDDVQALDESSIALLPYAAGMSERANLTLLFVEQSDALDVADSYRAFIDGLLARRVVQHLELGPMSDASVTELVAAVLGLDDVSQVPAELVLRAQGNPWFAKELAEAYQRGESDIPVSIAAAATSRLANLSDVAQDVVYAIALCPEGAHIGWLEGIAEERPRLFARTMEGIKESGLIREDGELISIAHPLMRQALVDQLSAAMRRALHKELAAAIDQTPMREVTGARALGYHLSQAGRPDEAVQHFLRAAEVSEIMGQLHEAVADYSRALEAEPRIEQRLELLRKCAQSAMQIGSERSSEYWCELGRLAAAKNDNELYAYALFHQYWTSQDGSAVDRLERAAGLGPDTYGWSARAAACLKTLASDYNGAIEYDRRAYKLAQQAGDPVLETLALEKLGVHHAYLGNLDEAIECCRGAVALATAHRLHGWVYTAWHALTESLAENLETERSLQEAQSILKYVEDLNLARYTRAVRATLARALLRCGRFDEARQQIEQAVVSDSGIAGNEFSPFLLWTRALVANEIGELPFAQPASEQALAAAEQHGFASWVFEGKFEQCKTMVLAGDVAGAVDLAGTLSIDEPVSMATLALWLVRVGVLHGHEPALALAARLRGDIEATIPIEDLMLQEVDATLAAVADRNPEALQHVARRWEEAGRHVEAARARTSVGVVQVQAGSVQDAVKTLTAARASFAEFGGVADADFVSRQLRALGTRSRAKSRATNVGNLTKRELQIARLVASGMRNAEVAGQLFLAEKTVAAHLSNIYGKLEVRSRVQLASWLKDNDPESALIA